MTVTVYFGVDWDKDGNYTDESARLKINSLTIRRGRTTILDTGGYTAMSPADVYGALRNYDNRYDPFNTSSAIYPNILPGRPARITVTSGGTTYSLFNGWLSDIRPMGAQDQSAVFRATDGLDFLTKQYATATAPATVKASVAMTTLMNQSDWPVAFGSNIEDNDDTITAWAADPIQTIYECMLEIAIAWGATIFINADGGLEYRVRYSDVATALTLDETDVMREFETSMPWDEIYNDVRVDGRGYDATITNSTSITNYGQRTINVGGGTNDEILSVAHATALANYIIDYADLVKRPLKVKLTNQFTNQFSLDIMDCIQVTFTDYGISGLYLIGYIEHRFLTRGNCTTTFYLEPYRGDLLDETYPMTFPFTLGW